MAGADDASTVSHSIAEAPRSQAPGPASRLFHLEAVVNGEPSGLIVTCEDRDGAWWLPLAHLSALNLRVDDVKPDARGWVSLDAISGLASTYESASQRLHLTVLASRRNLTLLRHVPKAREGDSAAGFLFNYDALAEHQETAKSLRAFTEQRVFGDFGVLSHSGTASRLHGESRYLRLDTFWTRSDPATLRTLTIGDLINRSLSWSRSVRLGGVQLARNFALRPDLVTWPVAGFSGEAAVPSTVDLYVNQVRQLSSEVPAGPFRVEAPPSLNGAGQATLVVRDVLGRETVQVLDLYVVPQLLAEGLTDYSVEAGSLREDYGMRSSAYRNGLVGSASLRHGISDGLTFESHAEGASGLAQVGVGLLWQAGMLGRIHASAAASDAHGDGGRFGLGYQYVASRFNLTAEIHRASRAFRDLASLLGEPPARRQLRLFTGLQLTPGSHVSASYVETRGVSDADDGAGVPDGGDGDADGVEDGATTRLASLGYRRNFGNGSRSTVYLTAFRDFAQNDGDGVYVGWSTAFGASAQLHSEYSSADERTGVTLTRHSPHADGWDWQLRASHGDDTQLQAATAFAGRYGAVGLDYAREEEAERWQASGRGAFVFAESALVAGRYVQDEFALISTNGLADVPVLHENRPAGRTNGHGLLLLPNVNAYQPNLVAIDPLKIPFGYRLDQPDRTATPRIAAGTVVRFPIEKPRAAVLVLVDAAGAPLQAGSQGEVLGTGVPFVVGYDGVVYLQDLQDTNRLRIRTTDRLCEASVALRDDAEPQADLGRVTCQ